MIAPSFFSPPPTKNLTTEKRPVALPADSKEKKMGKNFEEIFLKNCLEILSKGVSSDRLLGGGFAENIYRSFLNDHIAKKITDGGGIGVAPLIAQELITLQQRHTHQRSI